MIIHIGYVKTGSSFLQKKFFTENNGLYQVGSHQIIRDLLVKPKELFYQKEVFFNEIKNDIIKANELGLKPVLSFERLSGNPLSGGYDQVIIGKRLKELFPDSKIIIIFREQRDFIISSYRQLVYEGYSGSLKQFLYPPSVGLKIPLFDSRFLEYSHLINFYHDLFNRENVLSLPFEMFRRNPKAYFAHLFNFLDLPEKPINSSERVNTADRYVDNKIKSFTNGLFVKDQCNPNPILYSNSCNKLVKKLCRIIPGIFETKIKSDYQHQVENFINESIRSDNFLLKEMLKIDLESYNYLT